MDKIIERIRALLALGASGNQHEAENAMRQAARLMMKHEISEAELQASSGAPDEPIHIDHDPLYTAGRKIAWKAALGGNLAKSYNCRTINWLMWSERLGRHQALRIFGRKSDVDAVRYLFTWLVTQAERLAQQQRSPDEYQTSTKKWRSDWLYGFAVGIGNQLREVRKQVRNEASSSAIVLVDTREKTAADAYEAYAKLAKIRPGKARNVSLTSAFSDGRLAGQNMHLGKAVAPTSTTKRLTGLAAPAYRSLHAAPRSTPRRNAPMKKAEAKAPKAPRAEKHESNWENRKGEPMHEHTEALFDLAEEVHRHQTAEMLGYRGRIER